jgi:hypothetical protein
MARKSDASTRFLRYVMGLPGVGTYLSSDVGGGEVLPATRAFRWACVSKEAFVRSVGDTVVGSRAGLELPGRLPRRKLVPPVWDEADVRRLNGLIRRKTIDYLVFPILLVERANECHLASPRRTQLEHLCVLAYHKATRQIEVWDDRYPYTQTKYGYGDLVEEGQLALFLRPVLATFGLDALPEVVVPMFPENAFAHARELCHARGLGDDFGTVYAAFLANYLQGRAQPLGQFVRDVLPTRRSTEADVNAFFATYDTFLRATGGPTSLGPTSPGTRPKFLRDGRTQNMVYTPCPEGQVRDLATHECRDMDEAARSVRVEEHLLRGKHFYPYHITKFYVYVLLYLLDKYKNAMAMLPKHTYTSHPVEYSLFWQQQKRTSTAQPRHVLSAPDAFEPFMEDAMHRRGVRFLIVPLFMRDLHGVGHVNVLLVDKRLNTVERFEPNDTFAYIKKPRDVAGNGDALDDALRAAFAPWDLEYLDAMPACLAGFHTQEFRELSKNVHDRGGRCAEWSLWYMDVRLQNPDVPRETLMEVALERMRRLGSFKHYISGYVDHLVKQSRRYRDKALASSVRARNTIRK